jgi:hypothetical protein
VSPEKAVEQLETLSVIWRGGETEIATLAALARLYAEAGRLRDMFELSRRAARHFPEHVLTRGLQEDAAQALERLLLKEGDDKPTALEALALYFDFKEFAPIGRRGDEIVRRLADRLVELDLLDSAAELLQYQIDKRLTGAARATVAARLAAIRLMNGTPLLALGALQSTRIAELPEDVRRLRFLLEARAQSDLSRTDLALEVIDGETGADFARLRTSILWNARRWREAGEAGEALVGTRWNDADSLTQRERADVLRSAIAYALAEDRLSLDRLKEKFARQMLDSPDAKKFEFVIRPGAAATSEFRTAAQEATRSDSFRLLLEDWRAAPPTGVPAPAPTPAATPGIPASSAAGRPTAPARG